MRGPFIFTLALAFISCSPKAASTDGDTTKPDASTLSVVGSSKYRVAGATADSSINFNIGVCYLQSGLFSGSFFEKTPMKAVNIYIRDLAEGSKTYTCKQASSNTTGQITTGSDFESCAMTLTIPNGSKADFYTMYRLLSGDADLNYGGTCSITAEKKGSLVTIKAGVCSQLILKNKAGIAMKPIDSTLVASISSGLTASCEIK